MINAETRAQIINLINKEVVPAVGCTEPMAVALCAAKAAEVLGCRPQKVRAQLSANILKNAIGKLGYSWHRYDLDCLSQLP